MYRFARRCILVTILFTGGFAVAQDSPTEFKMRPIGHVKKTGDKTDLSTLQNLIDRPPAAPDDLPGILGALLSTAFNREPVPRIQSVVVLLAVMIIATVVGTWLLRHKEIEK